MLSGFSNAFRDIEVDSDVLKQRCNLMYYVTSHSNSLSYTLEMLHQVVDGFFE